MGSPVCKKDWAPVNWGSSVCDLLRGLLLTNERLYSWFGWMFGDDCKLTPEFGAEMVQLLQPIGSVIWSPVPLTLDPVEWVEADGRMLKKDDYQKLFAIYQTSFGGDDDSDDFGVPNLNGRVLIGRGVRAANKPGTIDPDDPETQPGTVTYNYGEPGGLDEVALVPSQVAFGDHAHGISGKCEIQVPPVTGGSIASDTGGITAVEASIPVKPFSAQLSDVLLKGTALTPGFNRVQTLTTETIAGSDSGDPGDPHNNMQPYMPGVYYIRANHVINGKLIP